jgi:hypothetical protein
MDVVRPVSVSRRARTCTSVASSSIMSCLYSSVGCAMRHTSQKHDNMSKALRLAQHSYWRAAHQSAPQCKYVISVRASDRMSSAVKSAIGFLQD